MTYSSELDFIMKNIKFHVHLWKRKYRRYAAKYKTLLYKNIQTRVYNKKGTDQTAWLRIKRWYFASRYSAKRFASSFLLSI